LAAVTALTLYRSTTRIARRLPLTGVLGRAVRGRTRAVRRWTDWAAQSRGDGPLLWIHGASVGESLAATPVVHRLRRALPTAQVVHSYSSPSAETWPSPFPRAFAEYVPWDERRAVKRVLDAVRPTLLAFSRGDLWPELAMEAAARAVPVAVIGGTVTPRSLRLRRPARLLYRRLLQEIAWIGAATSDDAARWIQLGAAPDRVEVTGDPRHDEVLERVPRLAPLHPLIDWATQGPALVAGSLEPPDFGPVCEAAARVFSQSDDARVLLVPHEPDAHAVRAISRAAGSHGISVDVWPSSSTEPPHGRCVIVDARGVLFDLFALAALAYVGGGFLPRKLHAVIEPAAFGLPVVFGPHPEGFSDAEALVGSGGAVCLPRRGAASALAEVWLEWLGDDHTRVAHGLRARSTLTSGAASRTAERLGVLAGAGQELTVRG
jgi:3-deoxy-D-manno-octulosonic-acid transferase